MKTILILTAFFLTYICQAATFTVQNTNDSGAGSLRSEIFNASNGDTIRFDPSLISNGGATITLNSELSFNKSLTIIGLYNSSDTLFISGDNACRIFSIHYAGIVTLDSLVLIDGISVGSIASFGYGGAIHISNTTLSIQNCLFRNNFSNSFGGGIYAGECPSVIINNSSFIGNQSNFGGGINSTSVSDTSEVIITNSTFKENTASDDGGGVYCEGYPSSITILNSSIIENTAVYNGGGIYSFGSFYGSHLTVYNSTFTLNDAGSSGDAIWNDAFAYPAVADIGGSIFIGNYIHNIPGSINSTGYNIFTDAPVGSVATDILNATVSSINLQPLAYNGGNTQTMLPGVGSIAIDLGNPSDMSDAQNRSVTGGRRDVGAAETTCTTSPSMYNEVICVGESIEINGTTYDENHLMGTEVFQGIGPYNCDSVVTVNLTVAAAIDITTSISGITITSNETGASYQWIDCSNGNVAISGATDASYTPTSNGYYAVVVTVGNCSDTSECVNISEVGLNDVVDRGLSIYPNPTTNQFKINNPKEVNSILITDLFGRQVLSDPMPTNGIIDVSNLVSGQYLVRIVTNSDQSVVFTLIKQ